MPCLDTTVLIDLLRKRGPQLTAAATMVRDAVSRGEPVCTTRINHAELHVGVEQSRDRGAELRRVNQLLAACIVLEFDAEAVRYFGRLKSYLFRIGRPAGDLDTLIASICLAHGQTLITRNPKHFADMPGLVTASY